MASHVKVTETLVREIGDRSYRASLAISAVMVGWAWLLAWVVQQRPSIMALATILAVPYLAWTYLPIKVLQVIQLALVPGLPSAPALPLLEGTQVTVAESAIGSLLVILVAGVLYASLTRLFNRARTSRAQIVWRWGLAEGIASLVTGLHLLMGLFVEAFGRTPVLGFISDVAYGLVYLPMQVVQFVYGQPPRLQQWGDWEVGTMLAGTGLLATLIAAVLAVPLVGVLPRRRAKTVPPNLPGDQDQVNGTLLGRTR